MTLNINKPHKGRIGRVNSALKPSCNVDLESVSNPYNVSVVIIVIILIAMAYMMWNDI